MITDTNIKFSSLVASPSEVNSIDDIMMVIIIQRNFASSTSSADNQGRC